MLPSTPIVKVNREPPAFSPAPCARPSNQMPEPGESGEPGGSGPPTLGQTVGLPDVRGSTLGVLLVTLTRMYEKHQRSKTEMSEKEKDLLNKVGDIFVAAGCSTDRPEDFQLGQGDAGGRPKVVDHRKIQLRFQPDTIKLSMRIELVELTELLSVLESVDDDKPCALWQIITEFHRWVATELPWLLDQHRHPGNWQQRIEARIEYLRRLGRMTEDASTDLDPVRRAGLYKRLTASKEEKHRRDWGVSAVFKAVGKHLQNVAAGHAKVLAERSTADLLLKLEHSIKGVVRPTMHAALIVMSNENTDGMVFSELARKQDGQEEGRKLWSWMANFKNTTLCQLLSDSIRWDEALQQSLHIVRYEEEEDEEEEGEEEEGEEKEEEEGEQEEDDGGSRESRTQTQGPVADRIGTVGKQQLLEEIKGGKLPVYEKGRPSFKSAKLEIPPGLKDENIQAFTDHLKDLIEANVILAGKLGKGMACLRHTQRVAKEAGEIMFAEKCSKDVNQFLQWLTSVVAKMLGHVAHVSASMDSMREKWIKHNMKIDPTLRGKSKQWEHNLERARELLILAKTNQKSITEIKAKIQALADTPTKKNPHKILQIWKQNVKQFCVDDGEISPPLQPCQDDVASSAKAARVARSERLDTRPGTPPMAEGFVKVRGIQLQDTPWVEFGIADPRRRAADGDRYTVYCLLFTERDGSSWEVYPANSLSVARVGQREAVADTLKV
jgi:hypothetical protein